MSSLTRDTRTPGHPVESATIDGTLDGRCARHERSAPAGDHAVALVLRQPCHELAGGVWRGCNETRATRTPCAVGGGEYKLLTVAGEILPTEAMYHDSLSPARLSMLLYVSGAKSSDGRPAIVTAA